MIKCSICKAFASLRTYDYNPLTEEIRDVKGFCSRCGKTVLVDYDCYEDVCGYPKVEGMRK